MGNLRRVVSILILFLSPLALSGCLFKKTVWIYTSFHKDVISEMMHFLPAQVPDAEVKWFQANSETIAEKLKAEFESGKVKADLVMISDPTWYVDQKNKGRLLPYQSPVAEKIAPEYRDPDHTFLSVRISLALLGYNSQALGDTRLPSTWSELKGSEWQRKLSMGNPLEYSTQFMALAGLSKLHGWEYFASLKKQGLLAEGGSQSVLKRTEAGDRPLGVMLLENILRSRAAGGAIRPIYPRDGVIPIPSPIAILKTTENPGVVKRVYDWFFSTHAQTAIIRGGMYSPLPGMPSPEGARPWGEIQNFVMKWNSDRLVEIAKNRDQIKGKFSEVVFH